MHWPVGAQLKEERGGYWFLIFTESFWLNPEKSKWPRAERVDRGEVTGLERHILIGLGKAEGLWHKMCLR